MTIEEARVLIPPGWVECPQSEWASKACGIRINLGPVNGSCIYAIPAPKPEPRRAPMGEMVVKFFSDGYGVAQPDVVAGIRMEIGGHDAVANTKWRLDPDAREWVEVLECL